MSQPKFSPTGTQVQAAQKVFIARAFLDIIKPIFDNIEKIILSTGNYRYDPRYFTGVYKERGQTPEGEFIRDPKLIYMIEGLNAYCDNQSAVNDAARYYAELERLTSNAGMINGQNTLAMAENDLRKAENEMILVTFPIHNLDLDQVNESMENRGKLIELTMRLFAGLVSNNIEGAQRKYFDERIKSTQAA